MKVVVNVLLLVVLLLALSATAHARLAVSQGSDLAAEFDRFVLEYGRKYATAAQKEKARAAFAHNVNQARKLMAVNPEAHFGVNKFFDLTPSEFKMMYHNLDFTAQLRNRQPVDYPAYEGSRSIDWRKKGAVTYVKNQEKCHGSWAFAVTGNIEGQWFLAGHTLAALSEQELLSCDTSSGQSACQSGSTDAAFKWLLSAKNGSIDTEDSYPFVSASGHVPECNPTARSVGATIKGHQDLPQSEDKIASYCYDNGPVAIAVDASSFQTYTGGILSNCQSGSLGHSVLIVGFDDTYSTPYWIVKNSWGVSWGEAGYIRIAKGSNQCGLDQAASTSLVTKSGPVPPPSPSTSQPTLPPAPPTPTYTPAPESPETPRPWSPRTPSPWSPRTPSPWSPRTPAPWSPSGHKNFTVFLCQGSDCSDCQKYDFPQGACLEEAFNGDSLKAYCTDNNYKLDVTNYVGSESCSSGGTTQKINAGACYENVDGQTYLKFYCPY